mmetsp:Transcript_29210/g.58327  ORF Transcript_29210/g.58327 Transcript_29210/m.58327 type:complete len:203 (-) Transcript_29210:1722-2330(-)
MNLGVPSVALQPAGVRAVMLGAIMAARIALVASSKVVANYVLQEGTRIVMGHYHAPLARPESTAGTQEPQHLTPVNCVRRGPVAPEDHLRARLAKLAPTAEGGLPAFLALTASPHLRVARVAMPASPSVRRVKYMKMDPASHVRTACSAQPAPKVTNVTTRAWTQRTTTLFWPAQRVSTDTTRSTACALSVPAQPSKLLSPL